MATIENTIDRLLVATPDQSEPGGDNGTRDIIISTTSPGGFKVSPGGTLSPAAIVFDAIPLGMDGAIVAWSATGAGITSVGNQAQLAAQDMEEDEAIVTASLTFEGASYERKITVQTVQDGTVGSTTYTWIRYADSATGAGISNDPTGKDYIGFAYNKATANESNDPTQYAWSLIKGTDGVGVKGDNGITYYTWIKYSDVADGTGLYDLPTATTEYIGIAVNRTVQTESTIKTDYVWSKFKGDKGVPGDPGAVSYVWMKYADTAQGAGMSDDGTGKLYIGIAYNKSTPNESTNPEDYTWTLIKGEPGFKGDPGSSLYTWLKYSDSADGSNPYDIPNDNTLYVGIAVNKATSVESTDKTQYTWSKFRGSDGVSVPGSRGAGFYRTTGNVWSDATADAATPGGNVVGDIVTISNGTDSYTKEWSGSAWFVPGAFLNGSLFVEKSITAAQINANGLQIYKPDGTPILTIGGLQPGFEAPGTRNSDFAVSAGNIIPENSLPSNAAGFTIRNVNGVPLESNVPIWEASDHSVGNRGSVYVHATGTPAANTVVDIIKDATEKYPVIPGQRYEASVNLAANRCKAYVSLDWYTSTGAYISPTIEGNHVDRVYPDADTVPFPRSVVFGVAPPTAAFAMIYVRQHHNGTQADPYTFASQWYVGKAGATQTVGSAWSDSAHGLASNAAAGKAASAAQSGFNTALAAKLDAAGNQVLKGPIALQDAGAIVIGTTDNGTVMSATGFAARHQGATTLAITSDGRATFGGELTAPSGTLGKLKVVDTIYGGDYTGYGWPSNTAHVGFAFSSDGALFGNYNAGQWVQIFANGNMTAPGFSLVNKQLTLDKPVIVNPTMTIPTIAATIDGVNLAASKPNTTSSVNIGSATVSLENAKAPINYQWAVTMLTTDPEGFTPTLTLSNESTATVTVSGRAGTNTALIYTLQCVATDANNFVAVKSITRRCQFGTPQ